MPVSVIPQNRRQFLIRSLGGASALIVTPCLGGTEPGQDPNHFAFFSDTHIAGNRDLIARGTNMAANLAQSIREVLAVEERAAGVFVTGDCAYLKGEAADYRTLADLVQPLADASLPVHFALGNHDHRENFLNAFDPRRHHVSPVEGKHVSVVQAPLANWFLLDSLDRTNVTPGVLGQSQLEWLAAALDRHPEKAAFVMLHHNPDPRPQPSGLVETRELLSLLAARRHVKALLFGHSHRWSVTRHEHVQLVNLPAVAYVFANGEPNGWVDARVQPGKLVLRLNCIDKQHPRHQETVALKW